MSESSRAESFLSKYKLENVSSAERNRRQLPELPGIESDIGARESLKVGMGEQKLNNILNMIPIIIEFNRRKESETRTKESFETIRTNRDYNKTEILTGNIQQLAISHSKSVDLLTELLNTVKGLDFNNQDVITRTLSAALKRILRIGGTAALGILTVGGINALIGEEDQIGEPPEGENNEGGEQQTAEMIQAEPALPLPPPIPPGEELSVPPIPPGEELPVPPIPPGEELPVPPIPPEQQQVSREDAARANVLSYDGKVIPLPLGEVAPIIQQNNQRPAETISDFVTAASYTEPTSQTRDSKTTPLTPEPVKITQPTTSIPKQTNNIIPPVTKVNDNVIRSNNDVVADSVKRQEVIPSQYDSNNPTFANSDILLKAKNIVFSGDEIEFSQIDRANPTSVSMGGGSTPISFPSIGSLARVGGNTSGMERTNAQGVTNRTGERGQVTPISGMDDVKAMIIEHEGIRYEPYQDSLGKWTIGVGHLIGDGSSPGPYAGRRLSHAEVMQLFEEDFARHVRIAEQTPGWSRANRTGQAAMIDLAFNMGRWWPSWPSTSRALESGDWEAAAQGLENSRWYTQVGRRAPRIVNMIRSAAGDAQATIPPTPSGNGVSRPMEGSGTGPQVIQASQENAIADRTSAPPSVTAVGGDTANPQSGSPGVGAPNYFGSQNDPGNVEPADAAERYARLFNMAA